jgi:hypothetical protein
VAKSATCQKWTSPLFGKRSIRIKNRLKVTFAYFRQGREPISRGAKPILIVWNKFIPLINGPNTQTRPLPLTGLAKRRFEFRKKLKWPEFENSRLLRRSEFASQPASRFDCHEWIGPVALLAP